MKYCSKCGAEIMDEAVVCPHCGCQTEYALTHKKESNAPKVLGILSIVFGALGGWAGLVLGIICIATDKKGDSRKLGIIGISLFVVWLIIYIILASQS